MRDLSALLHAFHDALDCGAVVWTRSARSGAIHTMAVVPFATRNPDPDTLPGPGEQRRIRAGTEEMLVTRTEGPLEAWVGLGPMSACRAQEPERLLAFLAPVVGEQLRATVEVELAANELAERYEEINLLYTTSEILGRTVSLNEAARTILVEISETVGARRGAILVHDRITDTLQAVAALGAGPEEVDPIAVDDPVSVSARVFRTRQAAQVEGEEEYYAPEGAYRDGAMLSVPILWTAPDGGRPLGVVNLSGRRSAQPFTAGDHKLVAAIATQIGTAIQNARLVRESLSQQRLLHEMQLAHDLQMRLLPSVAVAAPTATVAARVVPAESVGGDFYHLFPLGAGRTGVMIGDVSGHGYRAALIMALAMSAAAIHARTTDDPGEMLSCLLGTLRDELQTTEMFISGFYAVVDHAGHKLRYANTGHPHAFIISADGTVTRLAALDPPLGMVDEPPHCASQRWVPGEDLLLLFTDGISDARDRRGRRMGEQAVLDTVIAHRASTPGEIVDRVFEVLALHTGDTVRRDDLTLVVTRS